MQNWKIGHNKHNRAKQQLWIKKRWPTRNALKVGEENIIREPLVERKKIMLPPLHIKLGLMKQFVKALDKNGGCFKYLCRFFPGLSLEKLKGGFLMVNKFVSSLATQILQKNMTNVELSAWSSFVFLVKNFLGNHKALNYVQLVENMLTKYQEMGANMSIKVHFLHSHLDRFPENLGDFSEEQGERFHQDIKVMEERYQRRWVRHMMADYCWCLQHDCPNDPHYRKLYKQCF